MTKPDYTAFDAELLVRIEAGFDNFTSLAKLPTLRQLGKQFESERSDYGRVIDRRLQALRKAGKIRYSGGAWSVVSQ